MNNIAEEKNIKKGKQLKMLIFSISLLLLVISLTQVAYITNPKDSIASYSISAFLLGWLNIAGPGISWLANPLLILSWIFLFKRIKLSLIFSIVAVLFCSSFMLFDQILINEAGSHSEILSYGIGYWLWLSSCIFNFIATLILYTKSR
jgi:hypothetical protein